MLPQSLTEAVIGPPLPYWVGPNLNCDLPVDITKADFTLQPSNSHNSSNAILQSSPIVYFKRFYDQFSDRVVPGHVVYINDPLRTFSILEPGRHGGCQDHVRSSVTNSAKQRKCLVAINVGFFNASNGACYGNIASDGRLVQTSHDEKLQNAHFGIRKDGSFFFG